MTPGPEADNPESHADTGPASAPASPDVVVAELAQALERAHECGRDDLSAVAGYWIAELTATPGLGGNDFLPRAEEPWRRLRETLGESATPILEDPTWYT